MQMYTQNDMMRSNQNHTSTKSFTPVRGWLLASIIISFAFVVFVAVATQGSLSLYTVPHAIVAVLSLAVLLTPKAPRPLLFVALAASALAAVMAIFFVLGFANYYQHYVDYQQSLGK